jgi:hypothetical protein
MQKRTINFSAFATNKTVKNNWSLYRMPKRTIILSAFAGSNTSKNNWSLYRMPKRTIILSAFVSSETIKIFGIKKAHFNKNQEFMGFIWKIFINFFIYEKMKNRLSKLYIYKVYIYLI